MALAKLKARAKKIKLKIIPLYYALFDNSTPLLAKIVAGLTVGYLLSPIDLIPDFIPVLGLLDDLIIVPLLIRTTLLLIPTSVVEDIKTKIDSKEKLQRKWFYTIPVIVLYVYILFIFFQHSRQWLHF